MRLWCETGFPHLHTLNIPAYCFTRPIAVTSLKTLILYDDPRSYNEFLTALDRCALGLEPVMLRGWKHPERVTRARESTTLPIHLPALHLFRVSLSSQSTDTEPLAFLFTSLSLSSDTTVQLDWKCNPGNTRDLLPKHLVGLQVAPFFDSLCLHLFASPFTPTMHCYVGDAERLYVRERPLHPRLPNGRGLADFLDEHTGTRPVSPSSQSTSTWSRGPDTCWLPHGNAFQAFVRGLPNLRRLDLLGRSTRQAKWSFAKAFLELSELPDDGSGSSSLLGSGQAAEGRGRTLGYVCEVPLERSKSTSKGAEGEGEGEGEGARGRASRRILRERLRGPRPARAAPRSPPSRGRRAVAQTRNLRDVRLARRVREGVAARLSLRWRRPSEHGVDSASVAVRPYSLRFQVLVDEVVFIGHIERCGPGPGYRILPRPSQPVQVPMPKRADRGGKGGTASRQLSRKAQ